ncbi:hypothetical protein [Glaciihabitans sp. UYNi722]|uniref:hypothetical protein n=1 Tax=Glaciihabitans sp. UYNi722 TaxID=3156344 RepID=UPI0033927CD4
MTFTFSILTIITIVAAAFAIYDAATRLRGTRNRSILAIAELIFAALLLLSVFVVLPAPFTTFPFAIVLEVILVASLIFRGTGRKAVAPVTVIALVLTTIVVLISAGWLHVPGVF